MTRSAEQLVRDILNQAVNDGLLTLECCEKYPDVLTASEVSGCANLIASFVNARIIEERDRRIKNEAY